MSHSRLPLIIAGCGGFARETLWIAEELPSDWEPVGFLDDSPELSGCTIDSLPVLGPLSSWVDYPEASFVIAVGSPRTRRQMVAAMLLLGQPRFGVLVHPSVRKSRRVSMGQGSIVAANVVLTTNIQIGSHCILNLGVTVGHDAVVSDFSTIAPLVAVSGNVRLEEGVEVGTGASIIQGLTLARGSMLGAGGVLTKDLAPGSLAAGVPARQIKTLDPF